MPSVLSKLQKRAAGPPKGSATRLSVPKPVQTSYVSMPVEIPDDFLSHPAEDAQPIEKKNIQFETSTLPEYAGSYAVILDNALSPSECATLLGLAEESAGVNKNGPGWKQALVSAGGNLEFLATDYRNSDRIIWDSPEIAERIWQRCLTANGIGEELAKIEDNSSMLGEFAVQKGEQWRFTRANERLRFLKYGPGQFFASHCDGSYRNPDPSKTERSHYTLHLYLNDDGVKGGATAFHSRDEKRHLNVNAKMGRILIFQHRGLLHSGEEVFKGTKFTMRTDLMYEKVLEEDRAVNKALSGPSVEN